MPATDWSCGPTHFDHHFPPLVARMSSYPPRKKLRVRDADEDDDDDDDLQGGFGRPNRQGSQQQQQRANQQRGLQARSSSNASWAASRSSFQRNTPTRHEKDSDDDDEEEPNDPYAQLRRGPKPEKSFVEVGTPFPVDLDALTRKEANEFLPIWKQEVRDERGRKRLHGAFTGGFSAGYFNTVGSKEGWAPSQYVSSRKQRATVEQKAEDFMDEEDMAELATPQLQAAEGFDILGGTAQELGRRAANDGTGLLGEALLRDFLAPASESMGEKILRHMGWRAGQGIGPRVKRKTLDAEGAAAVASAAARTAPHEEEDSFLKDVTFAPKDASSVAFGANKGNFGIGYEPHHNAPEFFRQQDDVGTKERDVESKLAQRNNRGGKQTGFGVGLFEEDDDDMDVYDSAGPSQPSAALRRLAGTYDHEEEGDDDDGPLLIGGARTSRAAANASGGALQDRTNSDTLATFKRGTDGKPPLRGFVMAENPQPLYKWFDPPEVPKDFVAEHKFTEPGPIELGLVPMSAATAAVLGLKEEPLAQLTPDQRRDLLGEAPIDAPARSVFSYLPTAEAEKLQAKIAGFKAAHEAAKEALVIPELDAHVASAALRSFLPFGNDPPKQDRYRRFLQLRAGQVEDLLPPPPGMSVREQQRELDEFARGAMIYKPLSGAMASRFTTAGASDATKPEDDPKSAAQLKQYGRLTRTIVSFNPSRLLCKRLNVPPPKNAISGPGESAAADSRAKDKEVLNSDTMRELGALLGTGGGGPRPDFATAAAGAAMATGSGAPNEPDEDEEREEEEGPLAPRPPMDLFRSIFGDSDDDEDASSDEDEKDGDRNRKEASSNKDSMRPTSQTPEPTIKREPDLGGGGVFKPTFRSKADRGKESGGKVSASSSSAPPSKAKKRHGPLSIDIEELEGGDVEEEMMVASTVRRGAPVKREEGTRDSRHRERSKERARKRSRSRFRSKDRDNGEKDRRKRRNRSSRSGRSRSRSRSPSKPVAKATREESDSDDSIVPELPPDLIRDNNNSKAAARPEVPKAGGGGGGPARPRAADLFDDDDAV